MDTGGKERVGQIGRVALISEKAMVTHSSTLAWKIPWTEEPGELQFMESQRTGHDLVTKQQATKS